MSATTGKANPGAGVSGLVKHLPVNEILAEEEHDHEAETILGTNQSDTITAGGGPQLIFGLNGSDTINAGGGPDEVYGGNGNDSIFGGGGPDTVYGGNGKDTLSGSGGPDNLVGGNGKDILMGGVGPDILTGGRGADIFVFGSANEAPAHGEGVDEEPHDPGHDEGEHDDGGTGEAGSGGQETITDFTPGLDKIDLSALGTVFGFSDGADENRIWAVQQGANTILYVDTNGSIEGDHPAEMGILLLGVSAAALTVDDFIL